MNMRHAILLALVAIGCRQQGTPLANPFLAPDRVPPPATRTPPPGTAVPYYGDVSSADAVTPIGVAPPARGSWQVGSATAAPDAVDADVLVDAAPPPPQATHERTRWAATEPSDDQIAIPDESTSKRRRQTASTSKAPRSVQDSSRDGGPSGGDTFRPSGEWSSSDRGGDVIQASFEAPVSTPATRGSQFTPLQRAASRGISSRYAFAPDYSWLQGRLEHTRASREWKLRYIPIDGETDAYGGSVILENPSALGDLAAGDFVRIRGELAEGTGDGMTFAPVYRIVETRAVAD